MAGNEHPAPDSHAPLPARPVHHYELPALLERRLLAVSYEHVGVGIVEVDEVGRMLRVNQKVCELMGHEAADLLGRSIFDETFPQDVAQDLGQFRRQVAGEIDRYTIEKRLARKGAHTSGRR